MTDQQIWIWIANRRRDRKDGKLSDWKCKRITNIPDFDWNSRLRNVAEWVVVACALAKEHGGTLPDSKWMVNNGFGGLALAIWKHRDLFCHIPMTVKLRPNEAWVVDAERLAQLHGGTLPNANWLQKNGYSGLYGAMHKKPHLFAHLPQHNKVRRLQEWIEVAEALAQQHTGVLPMPTRLLRDGYGGLYQALLREPQLFAHIPQNVRGKLR